MSGISYGRKPTPRAAIAEAIEIAARYSPILIIVVVWELCSRSGLVSPMVLPSPSAIGADLARLVARGDIASHAVASFSRAGSGLLIAVTFGTIAGILMAVWRPAYLVINPLLQAIYPIPKAALIPVTLILFGLGSASKIFLIALGCSLPVAISAFNGARGVEHVLLWSARSLGASELALITQVRIPAAVPELINGIRTALAMSFILLVSSELLISTDGLGFLIGNLGETGAYPAMFGVIFLVAGSGFFADRLFLILSRRILRWQQQ